MRRYVDELFDLQGLDKHLLNSGGIPSNYVIVQQAIRAVEMTGPLHYDFYQIAFTV